MKRFFLIAILSAVAVAGCHSSKHSNIQPPKELTKFTPTVTVHRLWKESVGDGAQDSGVRMRPAYADGVLYAASTDGVIEALDATSGKTLWRHKTRTHGWFGLGGDKKRKDARYAGGPGVGNGIVAVGTLDGHVYAMDAKTGKPLWTAQVSSEVIAPPVVLSNLIVVRTEDGNIYALHTKTGKQAWLYDQESVPSLSLRGNGALLVAHGVIFFGTADGKLVAVRLDNGEQLWDLPLATGEGRTEIQRLDDADAAVVLRRRHAVCLGLPWQPDPGRRRERPPGLASRFLHLHLDGLARQHPGRRRLALQRVGLRQVLRQRPVETGQAGMALAERAGHRRQATWWSAT